MRLFRASEPFTDDYRHLLGPLPQLATGYRYLLLIVDRFSKLTLAVPIPREDVETVASAFVTRGCPPMAHRTPF